MTEQRGEKLEMITLYKILFTIFAFSLIYKYCNNPTPIIVSIQNPKFTLLGPDNSTTVLPVTDNYKQLIDIYDFEFKINPDPCKDYSAGLLLLIIIASSPRNDLNRLVIRETWGRNIDSTKVVFLMGDPANSSLADQIAKESATYGDIVQGNFVDAYRNMTYKHVMGLKWVAHHCPTARYILKADDDIVVNIREMRHFLARELSPWGARDLIACQLLERAEVQRSGSKWRVTTDEYPDKHYPTYCAGWSVLYSQDVILRLLKEAQLTPYFWIDDVHITGVLAEKINIPRTSVSSLILFNHKLSVLRMMGPKYVEPFIYGPPELSSVEMEEIWQDIPESF